MMIREEDWLADEGWSSSSGFLSDNSFAVVDRPSDGDVSSSDYAETEGEVGSIVSDDETHSWLSESEDGRLRPTTGDAILGVRDLSGAIRTFSVPAYSLRMPLVDSGVTVEALEQGDPVSIPESAFLLRQPEPLNYRRAPKLGASAHSPAQIDLLVFTNELAGELPGLLNKIRKALLNAQIGVRRYLVIDTLTAESMAVVAEWERSFFGWRPMEKASSSSTTQIDADFASLAILYYGGVKNADDNLVFSPSSVYRLLKRHGIPAITFSDDALDGTSSFMKQVLLSPAAPRAEYESRLRTYEIPLLLPWASQLSAIDFATLLTAENPHPVPQGSDFSSNSSLLTSRHNVSSSISTITESATVNHEPESVAAPVPSLEGNQPLGSKVFLLLFGEPRDLWSTGRVIASSLALWGLCVLYSMLVSQFSQDGAVRPAADALTGVSEMVPESLTSKAPALANFNIDSATKGKEREVVFLTADRTVTVFCTVSASGHAPTSSSREVLSVSTSGSTELQTIAVKAVAGLSYEMDRSKCRNSSSGYQGSTELSSSRLVQEVGKVAFEIRDVVTRGVQWIVDFAFEALQSTLSEIREFAIGTDNDQNEWWGRFKANNAVKFRADSNGEKRSESLSKAFHDIANRAQSVWVKASERAVQLKDSSAVSARVVTAWGVFSSHASNLFDVCKTESTEFVSAVASRVSPVWAQSSARATHLMKVTRTGVLPGLVNRSTGFLSSIAEGAGTAWKASSARSAVYVDKLRSETLPNWKQKSGVAMHTVAQRVELLWEESSGTVSRLMSKVQYETLPSLRDQSAEMFNSVHNQMAPLWKESSKRASEFVAKTQSDAISRQRGHSGRRPPTDCKRRGWRPAKFDKFGLSFEPNADNQGWWRTLF